MRRGMFFYNKTKDKRPKKQDERNPLLGELVPQSFSEAGGKGWVNKKQITCTFNLQLETD
jgi:hypothetical protein